MCREANINKARGGAECLIGLETHSEYVISGNVRGYTGTLTGLLYQYGAFQTKMAEKSLAVRLYVRVAERRCTLLG